MFYLLLLKYEAVSNKKPAPIENGAGKFTKLPKFFQQGLKFVGIVKSTMRTGIAHVTS